MEKNSILKPVRIFGYCLIIMGLVVITMHFFSLQDEGYADDFMYFTLTISFIHLFTGSGVLLKKKWGYYCFRSYLYLLSIGFPIGTFIGLKMLKYIDEHDVKRFFGEDV